MAKIKSVAVAALSTTAVPAALVWAHGAGAAKVDFNLPLADLGFKDGASKAVYYLMQNGFKQSMADSIAGYEKELKREGLFEKPSDPNSAAIEGGTRTYDDSEVRDLILAELNDRFAKILSGDVGLGSTGPRLRGIDAIMRDIAVAELKNAYATNKTLTMPKGDKWAELVARYTAKNDARIRAEAETRQNVAASGSDIADLLGDIEADAKAAA